MKKSVLIFPLLLSFSLVGCFDNKPVPTKQEILINEYKSCDPYTYKASYDIEKEKKHDRELSENEKSSLINSFFENGVNGLNNAIYIEHSLEEESSFVQRHVVEYCNVYKNAIEFFDIFTSWIEEMDSPYPVIDRDKPRIAFFFKENGVTLETAIGLTEDRYYTPQQISYDGDYLDYLFYSGRNYRWATIFKREEEFYYRTKMKDCKAYKDGDEYVLIWEVEPTINMYNAYITQCFRFNKSGRLVKYFEHYNPVEHYYWTYGQTRQMFFSYESNNETPKYNLDDYIEKVKRVCDYLYVIPSVLKVGKYDFEDDYQELPIVPDSTFSTSVNCTGAYWYEGNTTVAFGFTDYSEEGFDYNMILFDFAFQIKGMRKHKTYDKSFSLYEKELTERINLFDYYCEIGQTEDGKLYLAFDSSCTYIAFRVELRINMQTSLIDVDSDYSGIMFDCSR